MKIKTSELEGAALDWATGVAVKGPDCVIYEDDGSHVSAHSYHEKTTSGYWHGWMPSTQWSQGGPLIDEHGISFATVGTGPRDASGKEPVVSIISGIDGGIGQGPTHLIAACRAIVAAKLGDNVDVPDALVTA